MADLRVDLVTFLPVVTVSVIEGGRVAGVTVDWDSSLNEESPNPSDETIRARATAAEYLDNTLTKSYVDAALNARVGK